MQRNQTAFEVASSNSRFLLSIVDALNDLSIQDRTLLRGQILKHNETNLAVMAREVKKKEGRCRA